MDHRWDAWCLNKQRYYCHSTCNEDLTKYCLMMMMIMMHDDDDVDDDEQRYNFHSGCDQDLKKYCLTMVSNHVKYNLMKAMLINYICEDEYHDDNDEDDTDHFRMSRKAERQAC